MFEQFTDKQRFELWAITSVILFAVFYRWPGRRLDHIPAVGSNSHVLSFIEAVETLFNSRNVVQRGADKYRHSIFKIPEFGRWKVVVSGSKFIEELRRAPEEMLSFHTAVNEALQVVYTLGPPIAQNPYHIPIVRSQLTRSLAVLFPDIREEVAAAFRDIIPTQNDDLNPEWKKFKALETFMLIVSRASNRIFVGAPLCRDPDFMRINIQFTVTVSKTAAIINLFPSFLRPFVGTLMTSVPASIDRAVEHLRPVIEERQRKIEEYGQDYPDKPVDFLSWLMDEAKGEETSLRSLTLRILTINFAAIHTSSMTMTHALFYLAAHPEYAQPMRDEIMEIVEREGWTHSALKSMTKVDSFMKESQRLKSLSSLMMSRIAEQPFTFSDGTFIPKGTRVEVAAFATHGDDANYPDPTTFDPFRFVDKTKKENEGRNVDMTSTHADFVAFGHGRHACPGRFFAANELKLMLAHIVMNYDVKLEKEGERPKDMWFMDACLPNRNAEVMFRKRSD